MPEGYVVGKTKYVVVTGSVISGVGKGTVAGVLARNLQERGLKVEPIKLEAYLNVDAGTLSPFRHGEVFVLDDGSETDLDLGTYERFLDKNLTGDSFVTSGRIYQRVIAKERAGGYLGRDVQFTPHVTGETKLVLRELAVKSEADVILIEIGGTVGDYENLFSLEALRELSYEEGSDNVCFVNVTYVPEVNSLGEQKSKAAQLGLKSLMALGIQPEIIVCRSQNKVSTSIKEKISLAANVPRNRVVGVHDTGNIYELPKIFSEIGLDDRVCEVLGIEKKMPEGARLEWDGGTKPHGDEVVIGIAGKYVGGWDNYASILKALEHCGFNLGKRFKVKWIDVREIEKGENLSLAFEGVRGLIVPGAFGKDGVEGKIKCIKYCRENNVPFLGLCYGFQLALVEYARNVCGLDGAHTTEVEPNARYPVIDLLPEQYNLGELGGTMRLGGRPVRLKIGSIAERIHGCGEIRRRFRCRFECNPDYISVFEKAGIVFSGSAKGENVMQILELPDKDFFMATQFHPELTSRPLKPDEVFLEFCRVASEKV
ncbi:MAG: CTP synthase [archaeon]